MKKILCPTDFSSTAFNAIAYASKLAQITGSSLTLLNIQSAFNFNDIQKVSNDLEFQCKEVSRAFKVSCDYVVYESAIKLSNSISNSADGYDLVVMGSNGPDDLYQFFTGTNAYNVTLKTAVPILIIPDQTEYSPISSIIYAYDYLKEGTLPLTQVSTFAKALNCEIKVLEVMGPAYSKKAEEELNDMQTIITMVYSDVVSPKYETIHSEDVARGINNYMQQHDNSVLALCSVNRNIPQRIFHKSVIQNICAMCNFPIFVFHE